MARPVPHFEIVRAFVSHPGATHINEFAENPGRRMDSHMQHTVYGGVDVLKKLRDLLKPHKGNPVTFSIAPESEFEPRELESIHRLFARYKGRPLPPENR